MTIPKQNPLFLLKLGITIAIFWLLTRKAQFDFKLLFAAVDNPLLCLFIFILFTMLTFINAKRWHSLVMVQQSSFSYLASILPTYLCIAFNNVIPGSIGGDVLRTYYLMKKFPNNKQAAIISALFDRLAGLMGIFCIINLVAAYYYSVFIQNRYFYYVFIGCLVACLASILLFVLFIRLPKHLTIKNLMKQYAHKKIIYKMTSLLISLRTYRQHKIVIIESVIISIISQIFLTFVLMLIIRLMGLPALSPLIIAVALAIAQLSNLLPLTPGGVGIGEAAFANVIYMLEPLHLFPYATVFFAFRFFLTMAYLPGVFIGIFGFKINKQHAAFVNQL